MPLTLEQIAQLFDELKLPRALAAKGSPIDIVCPNESLHTRREGRATCRLWSDVCPHLFCFHAHCCEANQELNTWLRLKVLGTTEFPEDFEGSLPETNRRLAPGDYVYAKTVARKFPRLLKQFLKTNPPLEPIPIQAVDFLRRLDVFKPNDAVWIGRKTDSGRPACKINFRTLKEWGESPPLPSWAYTVGGAFPPGCFTRRQAFVKRGRMLVLESDWLSIPETLAMARWVADEFSVPLLAAVDSGGKSLHCYFRYPADGQLWVDWWRPALIEAGFDPATFYPHQPVRLVGQLRENGTVQQLLWARRPPKPRTRTDLPK